MDSGRIMKELRELQEGVRNVSTPASSLQPAAATVGNGHQT